MDNIYESVFVSLTKVCNTFITDMNAGMTPVANNAVLYSFENFTEANALPMSDFVGLRDFTLKVDTELAKVKVMFGISTYNDMNLFRLNKMSGLLLKRLLPDMSIPIYDIDNPNGGVAGNLKIAGGTDVSPVFQALQRPLKLIAITAGLSLSLRPQ